MTLDDNVIQNIKKLGRGAAVINQLTSNQTIRAVISLVMSSAVVVQILRGDTMSMVLVSLVSSLIGYYFGENAPQPARIEHDD